MQITKRLTSTVSILVLLASLLLPTLITTSRVSAAADTCTWTGGGADNNFSTAANWTGCDAAGIPENSDIISFDMSIATDYAQNGNTDANNDISSLSLAGINLTGSNGSSYGFRITGNAIDLTGDLTGDQTDGQLIVAVDVTLSSPITYSVPQGGLYFGDIDNPGLKILDLQTNDLTFDSTDGCSLGSASAFKGSGDITTSATSMGLNILYTNAFTGNVISNGEGVAIAKDTLTSSSTVTINNSGKLLLSSAASSYPFNVVMNSDNAAALNAVYYTFACAGGGAPDIKTSTLTGSLTLQRDTTFYGTDNLKVTGTYTSNSHTLTTKQGSAGSITTSAGTVETAAKTTTIESSDKNSNYVLVGNKETTILNGERGYVQVGYGGILKGIGKATNIFVESGGTLAPGLSPGCISSNGLAINGTYEVELEGLTACTEYDQTVVTGTVDVTSGTLDVKRIVSYVPTLNSTYTIIDNDAADAVGGTFTGWAEGAQVVVDGVTYEITYTGGDGNDVVLTVLAVADSVAAAAAAPDTGAIQIVQSPAFLVVLLISTGAFLVGMRRIAKEK